VASRRASVVIPVFNGANFVARAIESVLGQTLEDFELIVVDDGSTDSTSEVVKSFSDPRLRYLRQRNQGPSVARNTGIRASTAEWIGFLDGDDYWLPTKLEAQLERARLQPDAGLVYAAGIYCTPEGATIADMPATVEGELLGELLLDNCLAGSTSSAIVRRDVFDRIGLFDETMSCCEDWELWLRVATVTKIARVEERLVRIVNRPGSLNKRARDVRNVSLHMLDHAFKTYAASYTRLRRRALWNVYRSAAMTYRDHHEYGKALNNILLAIAQRPHFLPTYWSLYRIATSPLIERKRSTQPMVEGQ
jgi:glycosyltransferase involved in cell wall biosynthesis